MLYFYPSDGSPGCTKQAAAFTESFGAFKKAGAVGTRLQPLERPQHSYLPQSCLKSKAAKGQAHMEGILMMPGTLPQQTACMPEVQMRDVVRSYIWGLGLHCAVLGVSGDDVESHVKFIGDQQIPFQLLADEGNKVWS